VEHKPIFGVPQAISFFSVRIILRGNILPTKIFSAKNFKDFQETLCDRLSNKETKQTSFCLPSCLPSSPLSQLVETNQHITRWLTNTNKTAATFNQLKTNKIYHFEIQSSHLQIKFLLPKDLIKDEMLPSPSSTQSQV
jgi:hypothetical protein